MDTFKTVTVLAALSVLAITGCQGGLKASATGNVQQPTIIVPSTDPYSDSPTPAAVEAVPVGQTTEVADSSGNNVANVTVTSVTASKSCKGDYCSAPQNGYFVVVEVLISVVTGTFDVNSADFNAQMQDGTTYTETDGNGYDAGYEPTLSLTSLHTGQKTRGLVVFDTRDPHGLIAYSPSLSVIASWKF